MKDKLKLVYIKWCDAISMRDSWYTLDEVLEWGDKKAWEVEESGWLIKETKEYILLSGKRGIMTNEEPNFGQVTKIPKTWIIKRKEIKL